MKIPRPDTGGDPLQRALTLPKGARFYRCALQVNPFEYLKRHSKSTHFTSEQDYNAAIVAACKANDIEVIAVTDHYRVKTSESLCRAARDAGICVFPAFEASTKDGVHILCLFDVGKDHNAIDRVLGACGIHDDADPSPTGRYDTIEFLEKCREWGAMCIAAHVTATEGLLGKLSGKPRINAWRSDNLLAVSLPGPGADAQQQFRDILANKNAEHRRDRPVAIINAQDVNAPEDLAKPGSSTSIKMSEVSLEGLRQAFLDPLSRIRLTSDPTPQDHTELVAIAWQGGFLNGAAIHFNENLNVLIGGRGTGKSTVVESLRYVLDLEPLGAEARTVHEGVVHKVLRSGTKISLSVCSYHPIRRVYTIERTVPNPPVIRDAQGTVLDLRPFDIAPDVEIFGQHEISELTKSREKLTHLLDRFVKRDEAVVERKRALQHELERSRRGILDTREELSQIDERLGALPGLEETLKRFQEAGLEDRLKDKSLLVREERVLKTAEDRASPAREIVQQLKRATRIDRAFLSTKALEDLPGRNMLAEADRVLERLASDLQAVTGQLEEALGRADASFSEIRRRWADREKSVNQAYEKILRDLQKASVDGDEFIRLRRQVEELRPLRERQDLLRRLDAEHQAHRRNLIAEWEDLKSQEFRLLEAAAKHVSRKLAERVRVQVSFAGNREPLFQLLRDEIGGRLSDTVTKLEGIQDLSLRVLAPPR